MTDFASLGLAAPLLKALASEGYTNPTPIQAQAIPPLMQGRDLLGIAQTGTGKTAAFALPIIHRLVAENRRPERRSCRALILSPTRELASQIADSIRSYARNYRLSIAVVFGGVASGPQARALHAGLDILVATPGRLLDHMSTGNVDLKHTSVFVLDEADQMLDLGFVVPIRRIVAKLPAKRQNLFFSATMPKAIGALAADLLTDPVEVSVTPVATTAERVEQRIIFLETAQKREALVKLLSDPAMSRVLVFARTKHGADKVTKHLELAGIGSAAIHGNKSQAQREKALAGFKNGRVRALVATDIAARGIDVDAVSHVINFDLPNVAESYVHRIGRTARAGATGIAISFCDGEERAFLRDIERTTRQTIPAFDVAGNPVERSNEPIRRGPAQPHRHGGKRPDGAKRFEGAKRPEARGNGERTSTWSPIGRPASAGQPKPANKRRRHWRDRPQGETGRAS